MVTRTFALLLAPLVALAGGPPQTARERYDQVYPHFVNSSTLPQANEDASYAWGASYGMLSDVDMYAATQETVYLDRALGKMSNVLANRDDRRGVVDYRGISMAAWRNINYQLPSGVTYTFGAPNNDQYAYCYVVHSGMITYPMVALAELIRNSQAAGDYQGQSYQDWANYLIARTEETVAAHEINGPISAPTRATTTSGMCPPISPGTPTAAEISPSIKATRSERR
jgi:hypothetical protein